MVSITNLPHSVRMILRCKLLFLSMVATICAVATNPQRLDENDSLVFLQKPSFLIYYNIDKCTPALVVWKLSGAKLGRITRPASKGFAQDRSLPKPRAKSSDFTSTGYQRGHMCPSADWSANVDLMKATFIMSNVAPMTPTLNMVQWAQAEDYSRYLARHGYNCRLIAGAFFSGDSLISLGSSKIGVPDSFFRACIVPSCPRLSVYWLFANDHHQRAESACRVDRSRFLMSIRSKVRFYIDQLNIL